MWVSVKGFFGFSTATLARKTNREAGNEIQNVVKIDHLRSRKRDLRMGGSVPYLSPESWYRHADSWVGQMGFVHSDPCGNRSFLGIAISDVATGRQDS